MDINYSACLWSSRMLIMTFVASCKMEKKKGKTEKEILFG